MASCVNCGKSIGLLEYTLGDSSHVGLCKNCRKTTKWCDNCVYMLTISMENSSVIRCIKYGYNLTNKKEWAKAANCQDFTPKIAPDTKKPAKANKNKNRLKTTSPTKAKKGKSNGWF